MPPGAMACWVFISCLEVIKLCDSHKKEDNPSEKQMNSKYLYTASLWDYARIKVSSIPHCLSLNIYIYMSCAVIDQRDIMFQGFPSVHLSICPSHFDGYLLQLNLYDNRSV